MSFRINNKNAKIKVKMPHHPQTKIYFIRNNQSSNYDKRPQA
jgi:hypothetical protein